jgi:hypothetical protein
LVVGFWFLVKKPDRFSFPSSSLGTQILLQALLGDIYILRATYLN